MATTYDYEQALLTIKEPGATLYIQLSTRPIYDRFSIFHGNYGTSIKPAVARRLQRELADQLVVVSEQPNRSKVGAFKELALAKPSIVENKDFLGIMGYHGLRSM